VARAALALSKLPAQNPGHKEAYGLDPALLS